jgi:hypothetical protein
MAKVISTLFISADGVAETGIKGILIPGSISVVQQLLAAG